MKWLKFALVLIVILILGVFLLPSTTHVERQIIISAAPQHIFPYLNDYRRFNEWSPWFGRDPDAEYEFSGPQTGVGSRMRWQSDHEQVGSGVQEIVVSEPFSYLKVRLEFGEGGPAQADYQLSQVEGGTQVIWALHLDHGWNPLSRVFGLMMDGWVGPDYEAGLHNLKRITERSTGAG